MLVECGRVREVGTVGCKTEDYEGEEPLGGTEREDKVEGHFWRVARDADLWYVYLRFVG